MLKQFSYTQIALVALSVVVLLLGIAWQHITHGTTIYRTSYGFFPSTLTVPVGATVTFKNISQSLMWPASDVHPSHTVYRQFDPKNTFEPGEAWSFTFNRQGRWKYHDHVASQFVGTVEVYGEGGDLSFDCGEDDRVACWLAEIEESLATDGVAKAYEVFKDIHDEYPDFAARCHNFAHDIGLKAYVHYGKDAEYGPETSYCNAGFFHGFMEGFIDGLDQVPVASGYCTEVGKRLSAEFPLAEKQCRHGIGHGVLEYFIVFQPEMLIDPTNMLREAVAICSDIHTDDDDLMRCSSGAFNVYRDFIGVHEDYTDIIASGEMLTVCREVETEHEKQGCYWEMAKLFYDNDETTAVLTAIDQDEPVSFAFLKGVITEADTEYVAWMTRSWSNNVGKRGINDFSAETASRVCEHIPSAFRSHCLFGVLEGIFSSAKPFEEHQHVIQICESTHLSADEKTDCYTIFQGTLKENYSDDELQRQCQYIPAEYYLENHCT